MYSSYRMELMSKIDLVNKLERNGYGLVHKERIESAPEPVTMDEVYACLAMLAFIAVLTVGAIILA